MTREGARAGATGRLLALLALLPVAPGCLDWDDLRASKRALPGSEATLAAWSFSGARLPPLGAGFRVPDLAPRPPEVALTVDSEEAPVLRGGFLAFPYGALASSTAAGQALARALHAAPAGFTIELWFQDVPAEAQFRVLFFSDNWGPLIGVGNGELGVDLHHDDTHVLDLSVALPPPPRRHHVVATFRRMTGLVVVYMDGNVAGSSMDSAGAWLREPAAVRLGLGGGEPAFQLLSAAVHDAPFDELTARQRFAAGPDAL